MGTKRVMKSRVLVLRISGAGGHLVLRERERKREREREGCRGKKGG